MNRKMISALLAVILLTPGYGLGKVEPSENEKREPKNSREDVSQIGDRDVGKSINFYSLEKEMKLGKQLALEVEQNAKIVDDPAIAEYVNRIGQNIVNNSDSKVPFTIKVIDSEEVNAFALPGGYFYVNTGLIELAGDEAELAGVMAHEIAHVAARHGTRSATKGQLSQLMTIPLMLIGGWAGYGIQQAANFALPMTMLKFSRAFEIEADFLGVQYLYKTGYDPSSMVQFFERLKSLQKKKKSSIAAAFSTHPLTTKRIRIVQSTIDELLPEQSEYAVTSSEFESIKARIAKLNGHHKTMTTEENRPTLKRDAPTDTIDTIETDTQNDTGDEDDRPVLTRRKKA